jgi:hypothetical protein
MPKRSRKQKPTVSITPARDANQSAFDVLQEMIARTDADGGKDPLAVLLGRRGGLKGGHARAAKMSAKERSVSAKKAAQARWGGKPKP